MMIHTLHLQQKDHDKTNLMSKALKLTNCSLYHASFFFLECVMWVLCELSDVCVCVALCLCVTVCVCLCIYELID